LKIELFIVASKHILTLQFYKGINNFRIESNENMELRVSLREMKRYVNSMTLNNRFCLFGKLQLDYPDEIINNNGFPLARERHVFSIGYILICHPCKTCPQL